MKTYITVYLPDNLLTIVEVRNDYVFAENENIFVQELENDKSKLALRYRYQKETNEVVDFYPTMSDEEILAEILVVHQSSMSGSALDRLKQEKLQQVRQHFNQLMNGIVAQSAAYEVATWDTQRVEYTAWLSNNEAPTPYVSALAESRSLTLQDLMARIGLKIEAAARLQGTQHATESLVEAASSEEEIDAIVMPVL